VEHRGNDVKLLEYDGNNSVSWDTLMSPISIRLDHQRTFELVRHAEIVADQPASLVLRSPVRSGYGLHQSMTAYGSVEIHCVESRRVKALESHFAYGDQLERIIGVTEPRRKPLPARLVADVRLPFGRVRRRACHDDLADPLVVSIAVRLRAKSDDCVVVETNAYTPAHADDDGLAVEHFQVAIGVLGDVLCNADDALIGADCPVEANPLGLQALNVFDLGSSRDLLEFQTDVRALRLVERRLGHPCLADGSREVGSIRAGDIINIFLTTAYG